MTSTIGKPRTYDYEAVDQAGNRSKGKVDATSEAAATAALRQQGVIPLSMSETGRGLKRDIAIPGLSGHISLKDLSLFSRQFATMTSSGLSLLRCLAILEEQTSNPALAKAVREVRRDIETGTSLSVALAKHPKAFPRLMIALIRAGETGGFLDSALERVAGNFEKDGALRAKIKSAMTYPVIVLCFSVLMVAGVLWFIVPVFQKMFKSLHAKLPLPTQVLVDISHQMWWVFPMFLGGVIGTFFWIKHELLTNPAFKLAFDRFRLRLPVFGTLFRKIALSRFSRNLGTLLAVGVPVMQALDIVGETSGNAVVTEAMTEVRAAVRDGKPISWSMRDNDIFPAMVTQMVEIGEESGQISAMLEKVADFYERDVDTAAEQLSAAIEPVMVVVMGSLVGTMVIALYLPMFTVYSHISGATS